MKLPLDEQEKKLLNARSFTLDGVQFEDTIDMTVQSSPRPQSASISTIPQFTFTTPQIKLTSLDDKIQFNIGVPVHQSDHHSENHVTSATIMSKPTYPTIRFTVDLHPQGSPERSTHEEGFEEKRVIYSSPNNGFEVSSEQGFSETRIFETRTRNLQNSTTKDAVDHLFQHMSTTSGLSDSGWWLF